MKKPTYHPLGDQALLVRYESRIDPQINERVRLLSEAVEKSGFNWLQDIIFTFQSLLIQFNPQKIKYQKVLNTVKSIEAGLLISPSYFDISYRTYEIFTVYGGSFGPDLERVAKLTNTAPDEVICKFSSTIFTVYFLGFLGAQPYLGGLPEYLWVPRLDTPRSKIPAGSVGIGGLQAGVVTIDQPSGFNFIGWTPLSIYTPESSPPSRLNAGDRLIFREIKANRADFYKGKKPESMVTEEDRLS
ncbi:MAG: 5-oxoprolinase subunit PxpB [Deltaproteobacteria bacterium]|nr:5-oxoprolinase subunit PxpB [Deltaproteobacteria bacterium]